MSPQEPNESQQASALPNLQHREKVITPLAPAAEPTTTATAESTSAQPEAVTPDPAPVPPQPSPQISAALLELAPETASAQSAAPITQLVPVPQTATPADTNLVAASQPAIALPTVMSGDGGITTPTTPAAVSGITGEGTKSFMVAFLLSVFLGVFGADRFYLGKIATGVVKLLTFGGLGIWATIDIILILANKMKAKNGSSLQGYEKDRKLAFIIYVVLIFLSVLSAAFTVYSVTRTVHDITTTVKGIQQDCKEGKCAVKVNGSTSIQSVAHTPLGKVAHGSGDAANFDVTVTGINSNPQVTGPAPAAGMQYVEIDISVTNNGTKQTFLPGMFQYQTQQGTFKTDPGVYGDAPDYAPKNVELAATDKQRLNGGAIAPGKTVSNYMLYEIPKGDAGNVTWFDAMFDTTGTKLGILDLK